MNNVDDLRLEALCRAHSLTVEGAVCKFLSGELDPLEGLLGSQTAGTPDLSQRHDEYLGQSYLDPHEED